jgi:DNA-directed RNA polymerase subunit N (RpoN/RPB10)
MYGPIRCTACGKMIETAWRKLWIATKNTSMMKEALQLMCDTLPRICCRRSVLLYMTPSTDGSRYRTLADHYMIPHAEYPPCTMCSIAEGPL